MELEATLAAQGFLVLSDSYFPGWQATVDEQPVPIFATNHLFRGVLVPPGRHRIRFVYHPTTIYWGAVGSVTGLFILVMLVTRRRSESAE